MRLVREAIEAQSFALVAGNGRAEVLAHIKSAMARRSDVMDRAWTQECKLLNKCKLLDVHDGDGGLQAGGA